jgi:hypothetical protein
MLGIARDFDSSTIGTLYPGAIDNTAISSTMAVGKTPLSVEDILAKQKAEKEEASKASLTRARLVSSTYELTILALLAQVPDESTESSDRPRETPTRDRRFSRQAGCRTSGTRKVGTIRRGGTEAERFIPIRRTWREWAIRWTARWKIRSTVVPSWKPRSSS